MITQLDTHAAALTLERELTLKRAERRARLLDTGDRKDATTPAIARSATTASRNSLARAVASLLAVLLPSHA